MMFMLGTNMYGLGAFPAFITAQLGLSDTMSQIYGLGPAAVGFHSGYLRN